MESKMESEMERGEWRRHLLSLAAAAHDAEEIRAEYYRSKAETAVKNLRRNLFEAHYADSLDRAKELLLGLIPEGAVVGCGDSHTLFAMDLEGSLSEKGCTVIPHVCVNRPFMEENGGFRDREEARRVTREIIRNYLASDVFLLGANAITMDGQIVNVDGRGNRIAGSLYGPERVIVLAGANKLVPDERAGRERAGFVSAAMNHVKYGKGEMPCMKAGVCLDCRHPERSCSITTVIHRKPHDADFHVILVGEELGF